MAKSSRRKIKDLPQFAVLLQYDPALQSEKIIHVLKELLHCTHELATIYVKTLETDRSIVLATTHKERAELYQELGAHYSPPLNIQIKAIET